MSLAASHIARSLQRPGRRASRSHSLVYPSTWMITLSDLLTLILTFFILRASFAGSPPLAAEEHTLSAAETTPPTEGVSTELSNTVPTELVDLLNRYDSEGQEIRTADHGDRIVFSGSAFLDGSDELSFSALEAVRGIGKALRDKPFAFHIESVVQNENAPLQEQGSSQFGGQGAAERLREKTDRFASPSALAEARAMAVVRQMIDTGVDARAISAGAYAPYLRGSSNQDGSDRHHTDWLSIGLERVPTVAQPDVTLAVDGIEESAL